MRFKGTILFLLTIALVATSCSSTKTLQDGQVLYTGAKIKFDASPKVAKSDQKDLKADLEDLLRPKPNSKILGMPIKLWVYNTFGKKGKSKGLGHLIRTKFGEPPVIASMNALEKNSAVLQNRLENRGYFHDTVTLDTSIKNRKLSAVYTATFGAQYKIRTITYPTDSSDLTKQINKIVSRWSLLKPKNAYNLDVIKQERERIDSRLKLRGFFYFNPDYIIYDIDSTVGNHQVDMHMRIKAEAPEEARDIYRIKDVVVFADYDLDTDTSAAIKNAQKFAGYTIVDPQHKFQPKIFARTLVFDPGDVYNRNDHNLSLNRLTSLGVYRFVKARFEPVDSTSGHWLNAYYYLTPTQKKSIRLQVSALSKSNNANGTEVSLNWRNRNLLKGAELFTASIYGGLEKQISGSYNVSTRRIGVDLNIYIPRIIAPFRFQTNSQFVPRTRAEVGYEVFNRNTQYTLTSYRGSIGYQWKENIKKEHQLNLINISYVNPTNITASFDSILKIPENIALRRSIEKQFIIGSIYNFNYNSQAVQNYKRNNFYFNGNLDLSGNILGAITGAKAKQDEQKKFLGTPFSQYTRVEVDFRHYLRLGQFRSLNSRIQTGIGYAYGNSLNLPFVKAFFAGGANDLRAFRTRSLGPGSYYAGNPKLKFVPEQPGDIKLEANLEYRAKLFSIVRWAAFIDAGNIWTRREDSLRPGSKFTKNFLDQVAIGGGVGLRFDVSILILRIDLGIPFRVPYQPEASDSKWVFDKIRWSNTVFNLAIGYPF